VDKSEYLSLVEHFELEEILNKKIHELSSGQAKMFGNIMALAPKPKLVLFDEPFENVDQNRRVNPKATRIHGRSCTRDARIRYFEKVF
jgi:ABC-type spermidine/putrescine transport systems, ATPase components